MFAAVYFLLNSDKFMALRQKLLAAAPPSDRHDFTAWTRAHGQRLRQTGGRSSFPSALRQTHHGRVKIDNHDTRKSFLSFSGCHFFSRFLIASLKCLLYDKDLDKTISLLIFLAEETVQH